MALASRRLIRRLNLDEIRGRVQQFLSQGWGLATAPLYRNALFIMSSSVVGAASGFVFYFIIARFYSVVTGGRLVIFVAISLPFGVAVAFEGGILLPRVLPEYRPKPSLDLSHIRPMVRFSTANYLAATIGAADTLLLIPLIFVVLGRTVAPIQAGYFQIATVVAGLLGVIPAAAFASFYAEASQNGATAADRHIAERRAIILTLAILLPAIAVLWFFGRFILGLFAGTNSAYVEGSIGPLRILIFGPITGFLNSLLSTRVLIRKQTRPLIVSAIISSAVTLGLGYVLLIWGGITGLAAATVVGSLSQIPYLYLVARKSFGSEVDPLVEAD